MESKLNAEEFLHNILDTIEQIESRLLVWGIVDSRLSQVEIDQIIDPMILLSIMIHVMLLKH